MLRFSKQTELEENCQFQVQNAFRTNGFDIAQKTDEMTDEDRLSNDAVHTAYECVRRHDIVALRTMLDEGRVSVDGDSRYRLLTEAVIRGFVDLARMLLDRGADVNSTNAAGCTALHGAAACRQDMMIELLLANGADIDARDVDGLASLFYAIDEYDAFYAHWFPEAELTAEEELARGNAIQHSSNTLDNAHWSTATLLVRRGANVSSAEMLGRTPLHESIARITKLWLARTERHVQMRLIERLLASGADVNAIDNAGNAPLSLAMSAIAKRDSAEGEFSLFDLGFEENKALFGLAESTAPHTTRERVDSDAATLVRLLLAHGAYANVVNNKGISPWHIAVSMKRVHLGILRMLLDSTHIDIALDGASAHDLLMRSPIG